MTTRCIRCGNIVQGMAQYCEECLPVVEPETFQARTPAQGRPAASTCPACGSPLSDNVNYCPSCGRAIAAFEYAGFWLRVAAALIDGVALTVVNVVIEVAVEGFIASLLLQMAAAAIYSIGFWLAADGQTPGKMVMSIKVVMKDGQPIDVGPAILRYLGYFPSGLLLGIGYLMIAFTSDKRGLHDYIAGTVVVRTK